MTNTKRATKGTFKATFSDGQTITRKSFHPYTHAWRVILPAAEGHPARSCTTGFSATKEGAEKAAGSYCVSISNPNKFGMNRFHPDVIKYLADEKARTELFLRIRQIEVVAVA